MNNEIKNENWMQNELKEIESKTMFGEKLPSLIFEENKVVEFEVDFNKPFEQWIDKDDNKIKKIIPVLHKGERKNLWLNIKNPLYLEIIKSGNVGKNQFKVMQVGSKSSTKYVMVD